jgi:hypothetical protein
VSDIYVPNFNSLSQVGARSYQWTSWFFYVFTRPVVVTTDILLRKDMGERYLTPLVAATGAVLIGAATKGSAMIVEAAAYRTYPPTKPWPLTPIWMIGVLWLLAYFIGVGLNTLAIRKREAAGVRWHSYCNGDWRLPRFSPSMQRLLLFLLSLLLVWLGAYPLGILLSWSTLQSITVEGQIARRMRNAVLDVRDDEIANANLQAALEQRPAAQSEGLLIPLPKKLADMALRQFVRPAEQASPLLPPASKPT